MKVVDKSAVLAHAKVIREAYIAAQGIPAEQHGKVMEPFLKDGDAILPLSSVVVIVTRKPSPTDTSDAVKVAVSANLIASPEAIAIEIAFLCRNFSADLAESYCMDPEDGTIAEGGEEAWAMYQKLRRREILATINDMVGQRKAQEDALSRMQGEQPATCGLVDANGTELNGEKELVMAQGLAESSAQIQ